MTDFEYSCLVALVQAYGVAAVRECVDEIASHAEEDGTSGQDRESYSDDQDRDSYTIAD
jgi:hypothetical protein